MVNNLGKQLFFASWKLGWPPDHLHCFVPQPLCFVLIVDSAEKHGLEAHLGKERGRGCLVSKGIDVPGSLWDVPESLLQPPQPYNHVLDEILVVNGGFVRGAPPCVDELQLAVGDQGFHAPFLHFWGLAPPSVKEGHLYDDELVVGMFGEFGDDCIDGVLDPSQLHLVIASVEILVDSFKPANIIVRMCNQMYSEYFRDNWFCWE